DVVAAYEPAQLGAAIGGLLRLPPAIDLRHLAVPRVTVAERLSHLRALLRGGGRPGAPGGARVTRLGPLARTLEALLFLSPDPVPVADLAQAADCWPDEAEAA